MGWMYFYNKVTIPIAESEIITYEKRMETFSDAVKAQRNFDKERYSINAAIPEAAGAVQKFTAWSPIIQVIAENMPGPMVLGNLEGKQGTLKTQKDGKEKTLATREVGISVSGKSNIKWDEEVKSFRSRLLQNGILKNKLMDIPVSQQSSKGGDKEGVTYQLRMILNSN